MVAPSLHSSVAASQAESAVDHDADISGGRPLRRQAVVIAAKLRPPARAGFELHRAALCQRIAEAAQARLVMLQAPAGFGKTTVMLQLRQSFIDAGVPVAWLTLDSADNDVGRFLSALAEAFRALMPGLSLSGGDADWPDQHGPALDLLDRIAAQASFVLFLDDFEVVRNPAVLGFVSELAAQLPHGGRLVIGSRGMPDLSLGRLRARGHLLEIETTHLRLSVEETGELLGHRHGGVLSAADVARLHARTEGWAAAVWLASLSLERRDDPGAFIASFSGSNAAVVDYLGEDVLARLPGDIRRFLLRTSILSHLDPSICNELCQRRDSAELLQRLARGHLFLVPLLGRETSYRYHSMFAEFLRAQLRRDHAEDLAGLHRAAANWYLRHSRPVPGIQHALSTGDLDLALPLLELHAPRLLEQGRVRLLARWMDPLVARGQLDASPMLRVIHAWAVCFARGPRQGWKHLRFLEQIETRDPEVDAHRLVMRPMLLAMMDRIDEAVPLGSTVLDKLPPQATFARGVLEITMASLLMYAGRYHQAQHLVDAARRHSPIRNGGFSFVLSEAAEGAIDLTQGRLRQALGRLKLAVSTGTREPSRATNGNTMAAALWAEALYEAGRSEQAERLLSINVPLIRHVGVPRQLITAHIVLARITTNRGDGERAFELLTELEHIGYRERMPRAVVAARFERVRILVTQGRVAAARTELARCRVDAAPGEPTPGISGVNDIETHDVAVARCAIAAGHGEQVIAGLRSELNKAQRSYQMRRILTLRLLLAQALYQSGDHKRAMRVMARAVCFAASEGYVRAFFDESPLVMALLRELSQAQTLLGEEALDGGLHDPAMFIEMLLGAGVAAPATPAVATEPPPAALAGEGLTLKELQVLRLVAEGLSNDQVAARLFVAQTTVRTHLRNVNVKLDARNRMEAVRAARRLGLLG